MYSVIGIGIAAGLIGIGLITMLVAGIKSLKNGKQNIKKIVTFLVPFAVFGVAYGITNDFADAGVATMFFMMGAMALLIALSGLRSTFNI